MVSPVLADELSAAAYYSTVPSATGTSVTVAAKVAEPAVYDSAYTGAGTTPYLSAATEWEEWASEPALPSRLTCARPNAPPAALLLAPSAVRSGHSAPEAVAGLECGALETASSFAASATAE